MLRTRVIPCLLVRRGGLVKTVRFKDPRYLGDPINAVRIFNEKEVDELLVLDISATAEGRGPPMQLLSELASECFMPLAYGGGVRSVEQMRAIFAIGVEKVALNTAAVEDPALVRAAADAFGSQSVVASLDVRKKLLGGYEVVTRGATKGTGLDPVACARTMERSGAGEILLQSVDRDGTMSGYDVDLVRRVAGAVSVPVIACGGAGSVGDLGDVVRKGGAAAAAAGSLFVFQGRHRAVLINFPSQDELGRVLA